MLQPDLENKTQHPTATALHAARQRLSDLQAELEAHASEEQRVDALRRAYGDDGEGAADPEVEQLRTRRAQLEAERARVETEVETARKAKAKVDWAAELSKQSHLAGEFERIGKEMEAAAREVARVWDEYETRWADNQDLTRRANGRAIRFGRDPLEQLVAIRPLNLPTVFLNAVNQLARRVGTLERDRLRDLTLTPGGPPVQEPQAEEPGAGGLLRFLNPA